MSVLIGHASIDEHNKARNGQAGDQTGKEVCTRSWWDRGWDTLLRPVEEYAEGIASACEKGCANSNIGYDQNQRNTLHDRLKENGYDMSSVPPCETDCSAYNTACCIAAGIKALEYVGNAPTTRNMCSVYASTGCFTVYTDNAHLRSDKWLKRGDILVSKGYHTVIVLSDGEETVKLKNQELKNKDIRIVTASSLNVRLTPMGIKLHLLKNGDMVNVVEQTQDGWCKIEAWVSGKYLR